jgi:pimeloyl-ACP methyl ester carboxylesterase
MKILAFASLVFLALAGGFNSSPAAHAAATIEPAACPFAVPARVVCGLITVPEDHQQPNGPTIRLPYAIIASASATPAADPVVFPTSGGPGGSALDGLGGWLQHPFLNQRDLILVEQRGTFYAQPQLNCPEADRAFRANFGLTETIAAEDERIVAAAQDCRERLRAAGINVAAYTTAQSAADLEMLRLALGYEQWNLYGVSYGTRLVLTVMRDYPAGVRSAILDSAYPPQASIYTEGVSNAERAIEQLLTSCAADRVCSAAYPTLRQRLTMLVDRLTAAPASVVISDPATGQPFTVQLTGNDLLAGIFRSLYEPQLIRVLPFVLDQLAAGNSDILAPLVQSAIGTASSDARGLYYTVQCHEDVPFNQPAAISQQASRNPSLFAALPSRPDPAVCAVWDGGAALSTPKTPIRSSIPTLILAGEFDPTTPPAWGRLTAATLPNSYVYEFAAMGHAVLGYSGCARDIAITFLNNPAIEPDADCVAQLGGPAFMSPDDLVVTPALYRFGLALSGPRSRWTLTALGVSLLFWLISTPVFIVGWWRRRRQPAIPRRTRMLLLLPALFGGLTLVFWLGIGVVISTSNSIMLAFGLPRAALPLLALPWLVIAGGLGQLAGIGVVWRSHTRRLWYILALLASLGLSAWLVLLGFARI